MKKTRRTSVLILLGLVAAAILIIFLTPSDEPVYNGRRLSEWVAQLHSGIDTNSISYVYLKDNLGPEDSCQAIRAIGAAAVPYLIKDLQARPSHTADTLDAALKRLAISRIKLSHTSSQTEETRVCAAIALYLLGPVARPALPTAERLFKKGRNKTSDIPCGALVLAGLGDDGLGILRGSLSTNDVWSNRCAIWGLAQMGAQAKPVAPKLLGMAQAEAGRLVVQEFWALDTIETEPNDALALTLAELQSTNWIYQPHKRPKLEWLADHSSTSQSAVPTIIPLLTDPDPKLREAATNALWAIDRRKAEELGISAAAPKKP